MATTEVESYLGLAAKRCDSCKGSPAAIFCGADTAFLCCACDARLHGANTLASRHGRVWLCEVCEQAPAAVTCKADAATLCVTCDADIHAANPLARRHERLPVVPFYDPFSAAIKPSAADGFNCDDEEENKPAAVTWMISGPGPGFNLNPNPNPKMMEAPDLNSFFAYVDPYLDLDYADGMVPVQGKPVVARGGGSDGAPPLPPQAAMMAPDDSVVEIDFALGKQSYSSYNGHSLSHSDQVSSSEVGVVPDGGGSAMADVSNPYGRLPPNPAAMMDREARVMRYREKRKNRKFEKTIRYASRKAYAETRPRIKGRFAKRVEMDSDVDRIYSSAATAVAPAAGMFVDNGDQQVLTETYPVDFKLTLDVEELTDTSYQKFITDLRNLAKGAKSSGKVPILPGKDNKNLFDVLLTTSDGNVIVRARRHDIYVQGYLMKTNKWMEFDVGKKHMVDPASTFLNFGYGYDQMESAAGANITQIYYTKVTLRDAVIKLSKSTVKKEQAKSLIFMAQMISEAARFVDVSRFFGSHLDNNEYLPLWMRALQNDFGKYSKVGQCYDKYKGRYTYKEVIINGVVYKTVDQLRGIFGLMLEEHDLDE